MRTLFSIALLASAAIPSLAHAQDEDRGPRGGRNDRGSAYDRDIPRLTAPGDAAETAQLAQRERGGGNRDWQGERRQTDATPAVSEHRGDDGRNAAIANAQVQAQAQAQAQARANDQRGDDRRGGFDRGNRPPEQRAPDVDRNAGDRAQQFDRNRDNRFDRNNGFDPNTRNGFDRDTRSGFDRDSRNGFDRNGRNGFDRDNRGYGFDRDRNNNNRSWDRGWRNNDRYDWQRYRSSNRNAFRLPRYYAPYGWGYGYRRFSIGAYLFGGLYARNYWISDPYDYRLPPTYYPYQWVRYYDDALLVDTRSGYVVDVIPGIFY